MIRSRLGAGTAALVLLVSTAGASCSVTSPRLPAREGPPPAWTLSVPTGENTTAIVGRVAVIANDRAVLGVDPGSGRELWRVPSGEDDEVDVAGTLIVHRRTASDKVRFSVVDPATGGTLWQDGPVTRAQVTKDAVLTSVCGEGVGCEMTRKDLRTGEVRWKLRSDEVRSANAAVGVRRPLVPDTGQIFASRRGDGRPVPPAEEKGSDVSGWYSVVVGRTLINTDHDPPSGDENCTVVVSAAEAGSAHRTWTRKVYAGRRAGGECERRLAPSSTGLDLIGRGRRIAASTDTGRPQVFDLVSGRTVWRGDASGVPIDGDGRTLLVREHADTGALSLLDFPTGRVLWKAPDPGLPGDSASWETAVTQRRIAVSGAEGDHPFVLVYDASTGRRLGRFPGWLQGLGDDWVAIGHDAELNTLTYDFIRV
ncbi:PQQ-binding-like beta-propeller repeat protein [Actinomadura mexicana]|uniref:PQQ-like domain-containing protein n=1 Tax=Actinomadura mexicana TaxID=134959 RepID=A0A238UUN6_9ACTN|nr:PQQ-binding-like beta-propeller repeat protein [Actinomadura mexicana]SNR25758.1 PQQ-like domain-containing protein [Actinomadura mexicana]